MGIRVGIIANEFYEPSIGRMGGFGWLAKAAADAFSQTSDIEPVFLTSEFELKSNQKKIHDYEIIDRSGSPISRIKRLRSANLDRLISIDWRPNYNRIAEVLLDVPLIVWVQDPRTNYDVKRINSLSLPFELSAPAGIDFIDCSSLSTLYKLKKFFKKEITFSGHAYYLEEKLSDTYRIHDARYSFLCDPIEHKSVSRNLSEKKEVIFLGRLDPIKRPWLFCGLAQNFPEVTFHFLGKNHFEGTGGWQFSDSPSNVIFHGHLEGRQKDDLMKRAWAVVNTSIHEALPISFLEALSFGLPILSMQNPDDIPSRFGVFTGRWLGDGTEGLPALTRGLEYLLTNLDLNIEIGEFGKKWVQQNHSRDLFIEHFRRIHGSC